MCVCNNSCADHYISVDSTDVQLLDAKPSELMTGAIDLWMKLAMNSSLRVIEVSVTNSRGNLVNSARIERPLHQREVTVTTDILPVDQYTISVLSCFNKSLTLNKTISTPSPSTTPTILTHFYFFYFQTMYQHRHLQERTVMSQLHSATSCQHLQINKK